jgi:hypothetical protein
MVASSSSRGSTEMTSCNAINAIIGQHSAFKRRANRIGTKTQSPVQLAYAVGSNNEEAFSVQMDEPVFTFKRQGRTGEAIINPRSQLEVLPTLNGIDPDTDVWDTISYAGVAIRQTSFSNNKPVAVKLTGKAKLLNTGSATIPAGAWVELYVMQADEARTFKARYGTSRIMAGLREAGSGPRGKTFTPNATWKQLQKHVGQLKPDIDSYLDCMASNRTGEAHQASYHILSRVIEPLTAIAQAASEHGGRAFFAPCPIIGRALGAIPANMYGTVLLSEWAPQA